VGQELEKGRAAERVAARSDFPSGTVTFLFTDIEGSTRLVRSLRDEYADVLAMHHRLLREALAQFGGHEVDTQGDAFFVAFRRARDAIEAAAVAQRAFAAEAWPAGGEVKVRMGIHTAEPGVAETGYHGLGVVRGSRIGSAAHGGQVLLSAATRALVDSEDLAGLSFRDLGSHRLRELEQPEQIFQLLIDGLPEAFPPLRTVGAVDLTTGREAELARAAERAVAGSPEKSRGLDFSILGPLEVRRDGVPVAVGGQKQRALLAALLVRAREVVSTDRLIDDLWGEQPPRTAATSLQNFVSQLRKTLGPDVLLTRAPGYVLDVPAEAVDARRFETLVVTAKALPAGERVERLREALDLWRGEPLAEFAYASFSQSEARRLEELRLVAIEERIDAQLELGEAGDAIGELEALVARNPLRERLRGQLMLALYRSGRQAEALQAYQDARLALVEGLGIDPGPALQGLQASILRQDDELTLLESRSVGLDADADHYEEVARAMLAGRVVCVLGRGVWAEPLEDRLAELLATRFELESAGGLSRVAQLVALKQGPGPLYDELHEALVREHSPGAVHEFAAQLPRLLRAVGAPNPLLLTTQYDATLEHALAAAGERFDVVTYIASGRDRGKFRHIAPDSPATLVDVPNTYAALSLADRPIVVKLNGQVDDSPGRECESFVVSEDDYIGYLAQSEIANLVPVTIAAKLRRSHFLFLGYPLQEWNLRVFLHRVWGHEQVAYRSWAVERIPDAVEREFWRQRGVDTVYAELDEYVERLGRRLRERAPAVNA
jgi:DNA-binding SARP family transcriptional activator/class 3 adenylate cyclase